MQINKTNQGPHHHWELTNDQKDILGFLDFALAADELQIIDILIKEPYRKQGHAQYLLNKLLTEVFPGKPNKIFLEVRSSNQAAKNLYLKFNFIEKGLRKNYYKNPTEDALMMTKEL